MWERDVYKIQRKYEHIWILCITLIPLMPNHLGFTNDCKYNLFKQTDQHIS